MIEEKESRRLRARKRVRAEYERFPFLATDSQPLVYEPFPVLDVDAVVSDRRVRELVPILEARTVDPVWIDPVTEDEAQLLIWWKYWRGVESGKIQRPLPKSRRPITLPTLRGQSL